MDDASKASAPAPEPKPEFQEPEVQIQGPINLVPPAAPDAPEAKKVAKDKESEEVLINGVRTMATPVKDTVDSDGRITEWSYVDAEGNEQTVASDRVTLAAKTPIVRG